MTPERWRRIEQLFEHGLEVAPEARAGWLESVCGEDGDLRREVVSLLEAHAASEGFLERPAVQRVGGAVGELTGRATDRTEEDGAERSEWADRRIGAYRVIGEVGRGGMSTVLLAERDDAAFRGRVAIKVLRGMPGAQAVQRFERERQILADLDHPGIARLRDAGTLADGVPYVVMDYVEGEPIDAWCERRGLGVAGRLELFLRVCDAVQAAHRSLIVHRDLKPANVLVTADGEPRLLDFGIAKPLDPESDQTVTRTLFRAMTPRYASPEQVTGGRITTATDVYSLGVILFELLTGRSPYEISTLPPAAWQRVIAEVEPPRASQVARAPGVARRLRGDLDTILQAALRKDPQRRYGSVEAFADDVRRHLRNLPVQARPDTFRYRVGKLIRRNRTVAVLTTVLFLLLSGFGAFAAIQARRLAQERSKAEESLDFLLDVFRVSDPRSGLAAKRAQEVSAREILDLGARRARAELEDRPEIQVTLLRSIGEAYLGLGVYDRAEEVLRQAEEVAGRLYGSEAPETLEISAALGTAVKETGEFAEAEQILRRVLVVRRRRLGLESVETLEALARLAVVLQWSDRIPEADRMLRDGIVAARRMGVDGEAELGDLLTRLGRSRFLQGDFAEAESLYREALAIDREVSGEGSFAEAEVLNELGLLAMRVDRSAEAIELFGRVREVWEPLLEPDHPYLLANLLNAASAMRELGRHAEAEAALRHVLEVRRERLEPHDSKLLTTVFNLGQVVADQGRNAEAEPLLREALDGADAVFGGHGRYVATAAHSLGACLRGMGRLDEAEALERRSLAELRALYGDDNHRTSWPLLELGRIALARGDLGTAAARASETVAMRRRLLGPDHPEVREAEAFLDEVRSRRGAAAGPGSEAAPDAANSAPASDG